MKLLFQKYVLLFVLFFLVLSGCKQENKMPENLTPAVITGKKEILMFQGKVVYEATATAEHTNDLKLFYDFSPEKIEIYFSGKKFRMIESGGLSKGNVLLDASDKKVWHLDTLTKIAYEGVYSDLDNASEVLKNEMPDHFSPSLEDTHETDTLLGYVCKKLAIIRSGFIRSESEAYIWVTDVFRFPPSRYDIQTEVNKVSAPIPLTIGYKEGAILKMQIDDAGLVVTYQVTSLDSSAIATSFFEIPSEYTIQ